jgi:hypothetical protein
VLWGPWVPFMLWREMHKCLAGAAFMAFALYPDTCEHLIISPQRFRDWRW